ncbi:MAG: PorT family protein [Ferruginibacter sp.]|nr:PorT family protein [Ferruginibacter sp.]
MKQKLQTGLVLGMLFLAANTFGQAKTYLDLMVNVVNTNLNYGSANSALADYKKSTNGIQAGASFQAGITSGFSLVTELYYMRKGGKLKTNNPTTTDESSLRLNTLELPVLARLHLGKFYMNAGPSIAYNLGGKNTMGNMSTKLSFRNSSDGVKRFDAGIQMGGGIEFPFKQKRIALDIRYSYGLTNLSYDREIHNRAVMISVHFSKAWITNPLGRK